MEERRNMFLIENRHTPLEKIKPSHENATILDVTSRGTEPWIRFSPFYPHGGIPVPFSGGWVSASVEGIWQGLKVFEREDIDPSKFAITTMKQLKRSMHIYGKVLGHRNGVKGDQLLAYREARYAIYLPAYYWVLEHCLQDLLAELSRLEREGTVIFLDYETNGDIDVTTRPLSHAGLMKLYLEGRWPKEAEQEKRFRLRTLFDQTE
jgi:uncharacterized protein DUF6939